MSEPSIFSIEKIYVKDLSLEIPHAPKIFLDRNTPNIEVGLQTETQNLEDGMYEVALKITISATVDEKVMFLAETIQAGIFQVRDIPEKEMGPLFGVICPNILFPYARETLSDLITRAGFPPVLLAPVNFDALYQQHIQSSKNPAIVTH